MASAVVVFVGEKLKDAALDFVLSKALGVELAGIQVGSLPEKMAMAVLMGQGLAPEASFEMLVNERFKALDDTVARLEKRVEQISTELSEFRFDVDIKFGEKNEMDHFAKLDELNDLVTGFYKRMDEQLNSSTASPDVLRQRARKLAADVLDASGMEARLKTSETVVIGKVLQGLVDEQLTGLMDIWQSQAVRKADSDAAAQKPDLIRVYKILQAKFLHVLVTQAKVGRLIIEAREAQRQEDGSLISSAQFYAETFYPMLLRETAAFRAVIEAVAVNVLRLPDGGIDVFSVPPNVAGMLGLADVFAAHIVSGGLTGEPAPSSSVTANLPGLPALAGVWGRIFVPGRLWVRRAHGATEGAQIRFKTLDGSEKLCQGTLHVRNVPFITYEDAQGFLRHRGYELMTGVELREVNTMLVVEFLPIERLPASLPSVVPARLEDVEGNFLANIEVGILNAIIDGQTVQFGTFTAAFTGGADMRALPSVKAKRQGASGN